MPKKPLKELRENAGFTQKELAKKTGIAVNTIHNWETEPERLQVAMYKKLKAVADALGVCVWHIDFMDDCEAENDEFDPIA